MTDYRSINPLFGILAEAEELISEADRHGLGLMVDLVSNHTSSEHIWFREALAAGPGGVARSRYHFCPGRGRDGSEPPNDWTSVFGGPAWTRAPDGEWYLHLFDPSQPDLNWANSEVRSEFLDIMAFWLDRGVAGFRVDVAQGLVKAAGYPDLGPKEEDPLAPPKDLRDHPFWSRPELFEIVAEWRWLLDSYDDKVMVAEAWVPDWAEYTAPGRYHQAFDFTLLQSQWDASSMKERIAAAVRDSSAVGSVPTWVLSNHDVVRHPTRYGLPAGTDARLWLLDGDRELLDADLGLRRARAALLLLLGLPGSGAEGRRVLGVAGPRRRRDLLPTREWGGVRRQLRPAASGRTRRRSTAHQRAADRRQAPRGYGSVGAGGLRYRGGPVVLKSDRAYRCRRTDKRTRVRSGLPWRRIGATDRSRGGRTIPPKVMSGVYLTRHGGPDALEWCDTIPVPEPGPGQVLIQVLAAGVNNTDINTRTGWYSADVVAATGESERGGEVKDGGWKGAIEFPRIQGGDLCGRVVACGRGVTELEPGDRVTSQINIPRPTPEEPYGFVALGSELDGAFAQYCLAEASELFDVSDSPLDDTEIAAMPCAHGTAWNLLDRAGVKAGQRVLVTGASGGVGMAAVQLASYLGAEVTGMSSPAKAQAVRAAGATDTLDRGETPPKDHFHAVLDVVGGPIWPHLIRALIPGGRYAVSGAIAGPVVEADLREIYLRDITIHGATFSPREVFARLIDLVNAGAVRPLVSKTYPLEGIAEAQEDFLAKTYPGKLVLIPPRPDG